MLICYVYGDTILKFKKPARTRARARVCVGGSENIDE